jgi:hypothetical protein
MKTTPFLNTLLSVLFFFVALAAYAGPKLLTTDPLTGLPLYPPTDSRLRLGNDPIQLPESNVRKSKTKVDFHSVYDSKVDATLAWYASRLSGFKKTHAYAANRSQDAFYTSDGTLTVRSLEVWAKTARTLIPTRCSMHASLPECRRKLFWG